MNIRSSIHSNSLLAFAYLIKTITIDVWSSTSFKWMCVIGTVLFQAYYFLYVQFENLYAIYSSSLGINNSIFFFGNLPTALISILQIFAILVTLIASSKIMTRAPRTELLSRPSSNFSILLAYVFTISILIYGIAFVNVLVIYASAFIGSLSEIAYGNIPTLRPTVTLLSIDLPVTLLFWTTLALIVRIIIRNTTIAAAFACFSVVGIWFLALILPFNWNVLFSSSSYSSIVVSDFVPVFPNWSIVINRVAILFAAIGLCFLSASLWQRTDSWKHQYLKSASIAIVVTVLLLGMQIFQVGSDSRKRHDWVKAHQGFDVDRNLDLRFISGSVVIDPGFSLRLNLQLKLAIPPNFTGDELIFSFNPGLTIEELALDTIESSFTFEHGSLNIPCGSNPCAHGDGIGVSIVASGKPNLQFGNLESEIDYLHSVGMSPHLKNLLGTENSVFNKEFVALLPSIRWYPTPSSLSVERHVEALSHAPDLFGADVTVVIDENEWDVAAPGNKTKNPTHKSSFKFQTSQPIPQMAVIASQFVSSVTSVHDTTIELLIHARHADTIEPLKIVGNEFKQYLGERFDAMSDLEIHYKQPRLTFVEVPNYLRTVSGYGMSFINSIPGLILVKESSIPLSSTRDLVERMRGEIQNGNELSSALFSYLLNYNRRDHTGGNLEEAFARQLHPYAYQQFASDGVALNFLRQLLMNDSTTATPYSYRYLDSGLIADFAALSEFNPIATINHLTQSITGFHPLGYRAAMTNYLHDSEAASNARKISLRELSAKKDVLQTRRTKYLKLMKIYRALREMLGEKILYDVVLSSRELSNTDDRTDSVDFIYREASAIGFSLGPFLREWLTTNAIPGFRTSRPTSTRVTSENSNDEYLASFYIRNDQDAHGVVQFAIFGDFPRFRTKTGPSIELLPNTSYQVNIYSREPTDAIDIDAFHSKNEGIFLTVPKPDREEFSHIRQKTLKPISWLPPDDNYIIVDNLDTEVEVLSKSESQVLRRTLNWLKLVPDLPKVMRSGVHHPLRSSPPLLRRASWFSSDLWTSYGKYQHNTWRADGDAPTVRFSVSLPSPGIWKLDYHFPYVYPYWQQHGRYDFILRDNDIEHLISIDAEGMDGWVQLGSFELVGPNVQLDLVSIDAEDSMRMVDAIRWKRTDE